MSDFLRRMRISLVDEDVFYRLTEFPSRYRSYVINVALRRFFQTDFSRDLLNVALKKSKGKKNETRGKVYVEPRKEKDTSLQVAVSTEEPVSDMDSIEACLGLDVFRK